MKIAIFAVEPWEKEYLEKKIAEENLGLNPVFSDEKLDKDHLPQDTDFEILSVFVNSIIDKTVLDKFPKLKFIAARSTGYDHIDINEAKKRNIAVSSVPSYGENTVAEHTFGLILALSKKIFLAYDQIRETGSFSLEGLRGFDLKGKTLGVVGTGRIGKHVIRMAKGFEMNVIACDPYPDQAFSQTSGFTYCSLEKLLKDSDIVTLHVPYMKETHYLINEKTIKLMKKGAYLINTSRGPVVETEALIKALKSGDLGGAGLDVLEEEGVIKDELEFIVSGHPEEHNLKTVLANHVLIDMPNVIVTPHNAFNTKEALQRILDTTVENIKGFIKEKPINLVK